MAMNLTISTLLSIISFLVCCTSAKEGADSDTSVSLQCPSGMGSEGVLWDVRFSSHVHIQLQGLDVDAVGNTYLGVVLDPRFSSDTGPVTFGSFEVVPGDAADIILIKMSPEGEVLWVRQLGGDGPQVVWALSACGDGLVLEGEAPPGTLVLGGEIVTASVFIASFDGAGQHSWTRPVSVLDADGFVYAQDMACNATGHLVLTGKLKGRVNFGGETVIPLHNEDGYLARFDPKGELLWASTFGDPASSGQTVAYTKNDDIVVAGSYRDLADFGGGALPAQERDAAFLARLTADGAHLWSRAFGPSGMATVVAVDNADQFAIGGSFLDAITLGTNSYVNTTPAVEGVPADAFLAGVSQDGAVQWSTHIGSNSEDYISAASFDADDTLIVGGAVDARFALRAYDSDAILWEWSALTGLGRMAIGPDCAPVVGFNVVEDIDLGSGVLYGSGNNDTIVAKIRR